VSRADILAAVAALRTREIRPDVYNPGTLTVNAGTLAAGAVADVATIGQGEVHVDEVAAAPGFDVVFDWAGVVGIPRHGRIIAWYNGGANHAPTIEFYDYVAAGWVTVETLIDALGMHCYAFPLNNRFVSGGAVSARFYHAALGIALHDLHVDYVEITTWRE
jgi:hypothetical protein